MTLKSLLWLFVRAPMDTHARSTPKQHICVGIVTDDDELPHKSFNLVPRPTEATACPSSSVGNLTTALTTAATGVDRDAWRQGPPLVKRPLSVHSVQLL